MKRSIANVAVLFSLLFALVLTTGVTTYDAGSADEGISTLNDLIIENSPEF